MTAAAVAEADAVPDEDLVSAEGSRSSLYPPGVLRWRDGRYDPRLKLR